MGAMPIICRSPNLPSYPRSATVLHYQESLVHPNKCTIKKIPQPSDHFGTFQHFILHKFYWTKKNDLLTSSSKKLPFDAKNKEYSRDFLIALRLAARGENEFGFAASSKGLEQETAAARKNRVTFGAGSYEATRRRDAPHRVEEIRRTQTVPDAWRQPPAPALVASENSWSAQQRKRRSDVFFCVFLAFVIYGLQLLGGNGAMWACVTPGSGVQCLSPLSPNVVEQHCSSSSLLVLGT